MYENFFLNNSSDIISTNSDVNLDILFNNLSNDVENVNKMIANLNKQKETNINEYDELSAEKRKLHKMQEEFETYMRIQKADLKQKSDKAEVDVNNAKQALERIRTEFTSNMNKSLLELDVARKEIELEKDKLKESMSQFESYKKMEMDKIHHEEEILKANQSQFEKYKEICNQKLDIENKKLEQKFEKFKGIVAQFNEKFKPAIEDEKE